MARLFLAIELQEHIRNRLFEEAQEISRFADTRLVAEENIHITLKFLGQTKEKDIIEGLKKLEFSAFDISIKGIGSFGGRSPRVVWAGCAKGEDEIVSLHNKIEESLNSFQKDARFSPHATIARIKNVADRLGLLGWIESKSTREYGKFFCESFSLIESRLGREGPRYETVSVFNSNSF